MIRTSLPLHCRTLGAMWASPPTRDNAISIVPAHILKDPLHLFVQLPRRHSQHAGPEGAELDQRIGGCHPDRVAGADLGSQVLDVLVRRLGLLGVDHLDALGPELFAAGGPVAVEDHHSVAFGKAGVAG